MRYAFEAFELDDELFELRLGDGVVPLRRQALDVLIHLVRRRDRVVSKRELVEAIWAGAAVSDTSLPQAIVAIRRVLSDTGDDARFVQTVRGRGYRFVAPVREIAEPLAPAPRSSRGVFVGRDAVMSRLEEMLSRAAAGRGGIALVSGEPGAGRTRVVTELAARGRTAGARVVLARCDEEGSTTELWPWIQLVRGLLDDEAARREAARQPFAGALGPVFAGFGGAGREASPADGDRKHFGLFDAIVQLLRWASRAQPLLLLVDDVHAADVASLVLLKLAARATDGARALLVVTYRDTALRTHQPLARSIGALAREDPTRLVTLEPLGRADVSRMAEVALGRPADGSLVDRLLEKTSGNALFLTQVLHAMSGAPLDASTSTLLSVDEMKEAIGLHLGELSAECRQSLDAAAVLGARFTIAALGAVLEVEPASLAERVDEASRARIVERDDAAPGAMRFVHALVRDVVYGKLFASRRIALHERAARAMDASGDVEMAAAHRERVRRLMSLT